MRRRIIGIVFITAVCLAVAGCSCGGDGGGTSEKFIVKEQDPATPKGIVQGIVRDASLTTGIPDVDVTVLVGEPKSVKTDSTGFFMVDEVPASEGIIVTYSNSAYKTGMRTVALSDSIGASDLPQGNSIADASYDMLPLDAVVSGFVYAGGAPVQGASVKLRNNADNTFEGSAQSGQDGAFNIEHVPSWGISYSVDVEPATPEYRYTSVNIGTKYGGKGWSNVIVVLQPLSHNIAYTNIASAFPINKGDFDVAGTELAAADNIIFHFGAPVSTETAEIILIDPAGQKVEAALSWTEDLIVAMDPASDLTADADPGTKYRVRFEGLIFKDGTVFFDPINPADTGDILFDVPSAPTELSYPAPSVYVDNVRSEREQATSYAVDATRIYLTIESGEFFGGFLSSDGTWDAATGIQLAWSSVPGARTYRIYGRNTRGDTAIGPAWRKIKDVQGVYPAVSDKIFEPGVDVFSRFGIFEGYPFEYGNSVQVAVLPVDGAGNEPPLPPPAANVLSLADTTPPSIERVEYSAGDEETGSAGIIGSVDIYFTENMNTSKLPQVTPMSGMITGLEVIETSWAGPGDPAPVQRSRRLSLSPIRMTIRGKCVSLDEVAAAGASTLTLLDAKPFEQDTGKRGLIVNSAFNAIEEVLISGADVNVGTVTLQGVLAADHAKGEQLCLREPDNQAVTSLRPAAIKPGDTMVFVESANIFYPGEQVLIYEKSDAFQTVIVQGVDTLSNNIRIAPAIGFQYTTGSSTVILPISFSEYVPRMAGEPHDVIDFSQSGRFWNIEVAGNLGSEFMYGDPVIVDGDGEEATTGDREAAIISGLVIDLTGTSTIIVELRSVTLSTAASVRGLGDVVKLEGELEDLSGNKPLNEKRDQFVLGSQDGEGSVSIAF